MRTSFSVFAILKFLGAVQWLRPRGNEKKLCRNCQLWTSGYGWRVRSRGWPTFVLRDRFWLEDGARDNCLLCLGLLSQFSTQELEIISRQETSTGDRNTELVEYRLEYRSNSITQVFRDFYGIACDKELQILVRNTRIAKSLFSLQTKDRGQKYSNTIRRTAGMIFLRINSGNTALPKRTQDVPSQWYQTPISTFEDTTSSMKTLDLVSKWLNVCDTEHEQCRNSAAPFVPSRLIDVRSSDEGYVSLDEAVNTSGDVRYVTLSHCWGSGIPVRLLRENLVQFKRSIKLTELSKTFQDAITVSRHLGLCYIWIDALCIIQDSEEDWQKEAAKMYKVYASAYCNLAATSASNGSQGMFATRDTREVAPLQLHLLGQSCYMIDLTSWRHNIEEAPLNKRGWVYQERVLARRNVHFTKSQVFWECKEAACSETYPELEVSNLGAYKPSIQTGLSNETLHTEWWYLVQRYSRTALTKKSDKFVALAGLAEVWQRLLHDQYVAGLWKSSLVQDLLWYTDGDKSTPAEYIAPSWSWASIPEAPVLLDISIFDCSGIHLIEIIDVMVEPASHNIFGQVKHGHIVLNGRLAEATFNQYDEDHKEFKLVTSNQSETVLNLRIILDRKETYPEKVLLLSVMKTVYTNSYSLIRGLVIQAHESISGQFIRLGSFEVTEGEILWAACSYLDTRASEIGTDYAQDGEGACKYKVILI